MKQETLFDINDIAIDSNYVSPTIKRKWSSKLRKYLEKRYEERSEKYGDCCCGYGNFCEFCKERYMNGCQDCIYAIKDYCKKMELKLTTEIMILIIFLKKYGKRRKLQHEIITILH